MSTITPEIIVALKPTEIFVFGSNASGHHAGGAAALAYEKFGARWGVGEGLTGQTYAIPTLTVRWERVTGEDLIESFYKLCLTMAGMRDKHFLITKVGCGIAGFEIKDVAAAWWFGYERALTQLAVGTKLDNFSLPAEFYDYAK